MKFISCLPGFPRCLGDDPAMTAAPRPSRDVEQVKADIREYGYGICEGVLDADTVAVAQERVLEQAERPKSLL